MVLVILDLGTNVPSEWFTVILITFEKISPKVCCVPLNVYRTLELPYWILDYDLVTFSKYVGKYILK